MRSSHVVCADETAATLFHECTADADMIFVKGFKVGRLALHG